MSMSHRPKKRGTKYFPLTFYIEDQKTGFIKVNTIVPKKFGCVCTLHPIISHVYNNLY